MDTKSETTKRIEEIIEQHTKMKQLGVYHFQIVCGNLAQAIATHLHQEVIRGKIEELKKMNPTAMSDCVYIDKRIADLERQIGLE